ncbi:hypothetical protein CHU98_g8496 [Xylaria longipes]|nr:hypothetical protein CHU98_g8496 [Xylaria longipes]
MKLLNTTTLQLKDFIDDYHRPPYAILSHTWGEEEVLYEDIIKTVDDWRHRQGASKILGSCKVARSERYGYDWIWIDTCCIEKKSSAELSEAINSMFKWYACSEICIAYLADVRIDREPLSRSRWFERGWTLQELIAPDNLDFWDQDWNFIAGRSEIAGQIAEITDIDLQDLLRVYSIARIMSWASRRRTTRAEDIAYCLLGLFNVSMPLLYGEGGDEAFFRLQMAIVEKSDDQSILAWDRDYGPMGNSPTFARSPEFFRNCGMIQLPYVSRYISKAEKPTTHTSITVTRGDITLNLMVCPCRQLSNWLYHNDGTEFFFGVLDCGLKGYHQLARPALLLERVSETDEFVRADIQLYVLSPDSSPFVPPLQQHDRELPLRQYEACVDYWQFRRVSLPARRKPSTHGLETRLPHLDVGDILDHDLEKCSVTRHYRVCYYVPNQTIDRPGGVVSLRKPGYERVFVFWEPARFFGKYLSVVLSETQLRMIAGGSSMRNMLIDKDLEDNFIFLGEPTMKRLTSNDFTSSTTICSGLEKRNVTATIITREFLGGSAPELRIEVTPLDSGV